MSSRVFQELRHTDVARLGELVDQLSGGRQASGEVDGGGSDNGGGADGEPDENSTAGAAEPAAAAAAAAQAAGPSAAGDSVRRRSNGSSRSNSTRASAGGGGSGSRSGGTEVDEYAANKDPARRAPPDMPLWNSVLDKMRLTSEQLESYAEVSKHFYEGQSARTSVQAPEALCWTSCGSRPGAAAVLRRGASHSASKKSQTLNWYPALQSGVRRDAANARAAEGVCGGKINVVEFCHL